MIHSTAHRILVFSLALLATIAIATAQEPTHEPVGVALLRPDSLAGWDYGDVAPARWIISQGKLSGSAQSTPLLSGFTVGDFELRFAWSVAAGGALQIGLPEVPTGKGLQIQLGEGDGCGGLADGDKVISFGTRVEPTTDGAMHSAIIRRSGGILSVIVDNHVAGEVPIEANRRFGLALAVPSGEATLDKLRLIEPRGNPLYNGHNLDGWFVNNNKGTWALDGGDITATSHLGLHYLRTDREYANFTLSLDYKISKGGNSGLAIRTAKEGWPSGDGMELQILDQPGEVKDSTMAIYGNLPPLDRADKSEQWNHVTVKADGRMISVWVNGEMVQQVNTARLPEIKHRHLKGWIGLQDHGGKVRFREIYLHEAPDGMGLDAWYRPVQEGAAAIVLDRLMNSERLSRNDGLTSGVVSTNVPKGGEHVLAELTGPGALVRVWRSFAAGRLAFYFDGEEQPRIECAAEHLFDHVPGVAHEDQPLLGCLCFAKSLKVVARDPIAATYRLEYVTFPAGVPIESYTLSRTGVPSGMLQAISYRHDGLSGGKLREAEIYDRIETKPRNIEPGTTVELARLDGAGIVNWLKLKADKKVLANNDLWLEVSVDGESIPAIAAPARFLFPAYGGEPMKDFSTLIMASRDGYANLLAMPYGAGITVSVRNRGAQLIENVAVAMSVDRATEKNRDDYAGRMRLRGIFMPAAGSNDLVRQAGGGRWVSLVYDQPEGAPSGIAALAVDGRDCPGWAMNDLDAFWGRPGEGQSFSRALSGRRAGIAWRYLVMEPVSFEQSLVLKPNEGDKLGDRLALFYLKK